MDDALLIVAGAVAGYLLGTFPTAVLVTRLVSHGKVDIRASGTGNPGGVNTAKVIGAKWGAIVMLVDAAKGAGAALLGWWIAGPEGVSWQRVASAVPPIRQAGVRAFVGSRGAVSDTTFTDAGEDAAGYGFPPPLGFVFNQTNQAEGGLPLPPGPSGAAYLNASGMAAGLVGGHLPIVVYYFPVDPSCPYLPPPPPPQAARGSGKAAGSGKRYWTMGASGEPDMHGSMQEAQASRRSYVEGVSSPSSIMVSHGLSYRAFWLIPFPMVPMTSYWVQLAKNSLLFCTKPRLSAFCASM